MYSLDIYRCVDAPEIPLLSNICYMQYYSESAALLLNTPTSSSFARLSSTTDSSPFMNRRTRTSHIRTLSRTHTLQPESRQ